MLINEFFTKDAHIKKVFTQGKVGNGLYTFDGSIQEARSKVVSYSTTSPNTSS